MESVLCTGGACTVKNVWLTDLKVCDFLQGNEGCIVSTRKRWSEKETHVIGNSARRIKS